MKKIVSLIMTTLMVLSGATIAFAEETNNVYQTGSENIVPYALAFDCGGSLIQRTSYTPWGQVGQVVCKHNKVGVSDVTWKRERVVKTTCSKCNIIRTDLTPELVTRCGTARP